MKDWQKHLQDAIEHMLDDPDIRKHMTDDHIKHTPRRYVQAFIEFFSGCYQDPKEIIGTSFEEHTYDEMIIVRNIDFVSFCAHHLVPFIGTVAFGYLPDHRVVGLSKIPRMVEVLSHRPQIQERLTSSIVDTFQEVVQPRGCGAVVSANHMCMAIRGVKQANTITDTIALRGEFLKNSSMKQEFLTLVGKKL